LDLLRNRLGLRRILASVDDRLITESCHCRHAPYIFARDNRVTVSMVVRFSSQFRTWLLHNLERGCAPADLVRSMVAQKFEPQIAHALVEAFARARGAGAQPPEDSVALDLPPPPYDYEAPRLAPGSVIHTSDREIPVLIRAAQPVLAVLEGVLSAGECVALVELARSRLKPSTVVDPARGENVVAEYRDSHGMFFRPGETAFIAGLERRIAQIMGGPVENGEGLQVLRYGAGAKTSPHFDFLLPSNAANRESLVRSGQRVSTLVIYLNDVARSGETVFPELGLSVCAKKGNAVYFEYANSRGQLDHKSLHAGAPVAEGEKWVATKWLRERRFLSA
jgi:prolyl 4-hydroxylase